MKTEDLIKITIKNSKELLKIVKFLSVIVFTGEFHNKYMQYRKQKLLKLVDTND
jgi:hypothetical protein